MAAVSSSVISHTAFVSFDATHAHICAPGHESLEVESQFYMGNDEAPPHLCPLTLANVCSPTYWDQMTQRHCF